MSTSPQRTAGAAGNAHRTTTPPTRTSPAPQASHTPPITTSSSRPGSSHKAQRQSSASMLNTKAMSSAKSFESARSSRGSRDSLISRPPKTPDVLPPPALPSAKEELVKTFQTQFDAIRSIITCKICYGLLYEPYTTTCGHTYCYVCFCKSFQPNQIPACPECRGKLAHPPAPAYAVRELTHTLIATQELLPAGETIEDHKAWQKEHADIIQKDKDNKTPRDGGLWRGFFRTRRPRMRVIRDWEDNVDRCPFCTWELEDGMCTRCGLPIDEDGNGDWEFSDIASEHPSMMGGHDIVIEEDYDPEDDFIDDEDADWQGYEGYAEDMGWGHPFAIQRMLGAYPPQRRPLASHSAAGSRARSRYASSVQESDMGPLEEEDEDEEEDEEEDGDSSMSGFINDDDEEPDHFSRESTSASESPSSQLDQTIVEVHEEDEDEGPVAPTRRHNRGVQSSTAVSSNASSQRTRDMPRLTATQTARRRRVISESPSTESTSSASAAAEDDAHEGPIPSTNRRRRRAMSQDGQLRNVRPRARGNSVADEEDADLRGYRPLGTPQIGDGEDEMSDGGRTEVGWEPLTHPSEQLRETGSLTPTADRPSAPPPRPSSRTSSFPLGSRGIRRRSSVVSVIPYEDGDADGESDTQHNNAVQLLRQRPSRARLHLAGQNPPADTVLTPPHLIDGEETDSGDIEASPQGHRRGQPTRRRRDYDPRLSMLFAQHQTEVQTTEPEGIVYHEFAHLRGINRTPVARPRTANRHSTSRNADMLPSPAPATPRAPQHGYSPTRARVAADPGQYSASALTGTGRSAADRLPNSPRSSLSGPSQLTAGRHRGSVDINGLRNDVASQIPNIANPVIDQRFQPNATYLRAMHNPSLFANVASAQQTRQVLQGNGPQSPRVPQVTESVERPASRVSIRNGYAVQGPPQTANRALPNGNRPPSAGSRRGSLTRSPFTPPQLGPPSVGLGTARAWHPTNPFFNGVRPRQSSQRLRREQSNQTLRPQPSTRVMRGQSPQISAHEPDQDSPHMRPQASRMNLRQRPSFGRLHSPRDASIPQYQAAPPAANMTRYPSTSSGTLSEDERVRRATELVQRRMQELAQQQRPSPAQTPRLNAATQQMIEQRLASTIGRPAERQTASASRGTGHATPAVASQPPGAPTRAAVSQGPILNQHTATANTTAVVAQYSDHSSTNSQTQQRASVNSLPGRSQLPAMAQGMGPITIGGDSRRM